MTKIIKGNEEEMKKRDYQVYFNYDNDGFSAQKNKFIIEKTIKDYDATREKKRKEFDDPYSERADAVVSYLRAVDRGKSASSLGKYFSKQMLAYLRGDEIRRKLMEGMRVLDKKGKVVKP